MTGYTRKASVGLLVGGWFLLWTGSAGAVSPAQLQCQVTYAGTTHSVVAEPVQDPYPVPSVDIGGRFLFKSIVVGSAQQVDRVLIYAYLVDGAQDVLIHQAKFLPPFAVSAQPLTGQQRLYAGPLERELMYSCNLLGGAR